MSNLGNVRASGARRKKTAGGFRVRRGKTAGFWIMMIVTTLTVFGVCFAVLQFRLNQGNRQLEEIRSRRNDLILEVQDLEKDLAYSKTDEYIMRAARDELGLIMPNEVRYVNSY